MRADTLSVRQAVVVAVVAFAVSLAFGFAGWNYFFAVGADASGIRVSVSVAGILLWFAFGAAMCTALFSGFVVMAAGHGSRIAAGVLPALWPMTAVVHGGASPELLQSLTLNPTVSLPAMLTEPGAIAAAMAVGVLVGTWYSIVAFRPVARLGPAPAGAGLGQGQGKPETVARQRVGRRRLCG